MTKDKALKLALDLIKKRLQGLAVEANLHDIYKASYPSAMRASAARVELREAAAELEKLLKGLEESDANREF